MRVLVAVGLIVFSAESAFGYCLEPAPPSTCAEYFRSEQVIEGTVVRHKHFSQAELGPNAASDGDVYTVRVDVTYRGKVHGSLDIFDENSSGRLPFPIAEGKKYLFFLTPSWAWIKSGWYGADGCGHSGAVRSQSQTLSEVEKLQHAVGGGLIEVRVSQEPGLQGPLAGFAVTLIGEQSATAETDRDGWARFKVPLGSYSATASKAGWSVTQFDLVYEDASKIRLKEPGQCSQLQLVAEPK